MRFKIVIAASLLALCGSTMAEAQSIQSGAAHGARTGEHAAGPIGGLVGGVVGGAVGGTAGAVNGALGLHHHHRCHYHYGRRYCNY